MKKYIILFFNLLVLVACGNRQQQTQQATLTVSHSVTLQRLLLEINIG